MSRSRRLWPFKSSLNKNFKYISISEVSLPLINICVVWVLGFLEKKVYEKIDF